MKIKFAACLTLCFFSNCLAFAQKSYEERYFEMLDQLILYPFDLLGKTPFQISNLQSPPEHLPINENYWSVEMFTAAPNDFYEVFAELKTGFMPMHVFFSKKLKTSYNFTFYSSMNIDFKKLKEYLENKGVVFNENGGSQIFSDKLDRGHFFLGLSLKNKTAVLSFFAVNPKTGNPEY